MPGNNLGLLLQAQNRLPEAANEYRRALKLSPEYAVARFNLGNVLWKMGQKKESKAELEKLKSLKIDDELREKAQEILAAEADQ